MSDKTRKSIFEMTSEEIAKGLQRFTVLLQPL